jgi:hypothetical protein
MPLADKRYDGAKRYPLSDSKSPIHAPSFADGLRSVAVYALIRNGNVPDGVYYLDQESQEYLADLIDRDDRTPSYAQAVRMHKEFVADADEIGFPWYRIAEIMAEDKPNQGEQIRLRRDDLSKYFPSSYTDDQIKRDILKGLDLLKRQRSRDAR